MRNWRESDLAPWAAMNADPEVRQYLGPLLSFEQASAWALDYQDDLDRYGFRFWALEVRGSGEFIGFTGLRTWTTRCRSPGSNSRGGWPGRLGSPPRHRGGPGRAAVRLDILSQPEILAVTMARDLRSQR